MIFQFSVAQFIELGFSTSAFPVVPSTDFTARRFSAWFGASPATCAAIFHDFQATEIAAARIENPCPRYFLAALYWLKLYPVDRIIETTLQASNGAALRHIWQYVRAIGALKADKVRKSSKIDAVSLLCNTNPLF